MRTGTIDKRRQGFRLAPLRYIMRIPVPWVFALTYGLGAAAQLLAPIDVSSPRELVISDIVGSALLLTGVVIAAWSLLIFRRQRTTTTPGEHSAKLVTWGPYKFSRNPMYISLVLAYLGEAAILNQVWPVIVLPFTVAYVNWVVIPVEEACLAQDFPQQYLEYCQEVRRWV